MRSSLFNAKRYQLKKDAVLALRRRHPWIFRRQISSAAAVFRQGQWLCLHDHTNQVLGYGIYDPKSVVGIRVLKYGTKKPSQIWIEERVYTALSKRDKLRDEASGIRLIHGENDGLPGIVLDQYGSVGVLQTYSASVDVLGRFVAACARQQLGLTAIVWKHPAKRKGSIGKVRTLYGSPPASIEISEDGFKWHVPLEMGQKGGAFLDLRGLRRWVRDQDWKGKSVLNLFSNTGSLGLCAKQAEAKSVHQIDSSESAVAFGQKYHGGSGITWEVANVFEWLKTPKSQTYDVIILDPPQIVSNARKLGEALRVYSLLHESAQRLLNPGGTLVTCCCSSRIPKDTFLSAAKKDLTQMRLVDVLAPESDHPIGFPEGDYLKIAVFNGT